MGDGGSIVGLHVRRHRGLARLRLDGLRQGRPRVLQPLPGARPRAEGHPRPTWCPPEPLKTLAAKAIPGFELFEEEWDKRAPIGWDLTDLEPTARTIVALLSDFMPKTTGEIVHVDGGYHAMGA